MNKQNKFTKIVDFVKKKCYDNLMHIQNVPKKMSQGTKRPKGQNVSGTKRPRDKRPSGQDVPVDK